MGIELAKKRILESINLADLIGEKIELSRRSGRFVGLCPFHEERSPSFTIFDDHYYCFGCQTSGDAIDYVRHDQGLSFMESLRYLAQKYNIEAPELEQSLRDDGERRLINGMYKALQEAQSYFTANLWRPEYQNALHYLQSRGFSDEHIRDYGFGLARDTSNDLVTHLLRRGRTIKEMVEASLAGTSERDRRTYDFYRHRIMIPIRDHHGRVIGFGGRTLGDDPAKYKNSRETALFNKSHVLFGLDRAKDVIKSRKRAIIVEGYMDALQLWNHDLGEAVACLGTAVTHQHLKRLSNLTKDVYLIFDGDAAGKRASLRTIEVLMDVPKVAAFVIRLPAKDDPDSYVRARGREGFESLIADAKDLITFAIETRVADTHESAIPELIRNEFIPWLRSIPDELKRAYLVGRIAELTNIDRDDIKRFLEQPDKTEASASAQAKSNESKVSRERPSVPQKPRVTRPLETYEREILAHLFFSKPGELDIDHTLDLIKNKMRFEDLWVEWASELISSLRRQLTPSDLPATDWSSSADDRVLRFIAHLQERAEAFANTDRKTAIETLYRVNTERELKGHIRWLRTQLDTANPDEQRTILTEIHKINQKVSSLRQGVSP